MAEISNSQVIGDFTARPTGYSSTLNADPELQLDKLKRYDKALGHAAHDVLHFRLASFYVWSHFVITDANNNTKVSLLCDAPWPFTIWAADVGCETCAATTGTVDILVAGSSILNAAEDVKTGAGTGQRVAPEVGEDDVQYGESVACNQTAGSAAAMVGGQAHLYCQRL